MPSERPSCEYVLDPNDSETWASNRDVTCYVESDLLNENGVWTCPHDVVEGEEMCLYHLPVEEKANREVVKALKNKLHAASDKQGLPSRDRAVRFIGGRFGDLRFENDIDRPRRVDFSHSTIRSLSISRPDLNEDPAVVTADLILAGAKCDKLSIGEGALKGGARVEGRLDCRGLLAERFCSTLIDFHGPLDFRDATFGEAVSLRGDFHEKVNFRRASVDGLVEIGATFDKTLDFRQASIEEGIYAEGGVSVGGDLQFDQINVSGELSCSGLTVRDEASFREANVMGAADFRDASFDRASFDGATFEDDLLLFGGDFGTTINLQRVEVGEKRIFGARDDDW